MSINNIYIYKNLPKPLSEEAEKYYLELLNKGDINARNILIEHNLRLVLYLAKKFAQKNKYIDDFFSIGTIGLIKAIDTFKSDKNVKLISYISICIRNQILMYIQKNSKYFKNVSTNTTLIKTIDNEELLLEDILYDATYSIDESIETEEDAKEIREKINKLSEKERIIIKRTYGIDCHMKKQEEIGKNLNLCQSSVSKILKKTLVKLKKLY